MGLTSVGSAALVARLAVGTVGVALLALAAGIVLLRPTIWRSTARTWLRHFIRALALAALVGVASWLAPAGQAVPGLVIALVLWLGCANVVEFLIDCVLWQRRHRTGHLELPPDRHALSDDEIQLVSIHEAGHMMVYGLFTRLPEDAFAMIDIDVKFEFGGFVSALRDVIASDMTVDLLAWSAMMSFGGAAAEQIMLGRSPAESAGSDFDMGERLLRRMVSVDPGQLYLRQPQTPEETAINTQTITALRIDLFARTVRYLEANRPGLMRVAAHLREHHSMDCEQFKSIWATVVVPPDCKRLDPPARVACLAS